MSGYPVILGGDHAAFEMEHAGVDPRSRPDWPLPSFDARDWAQAFCKMFMVQKIAGYDTARVNDDEGLMTTWFANALMRGFDEHAARVAKDRDWTCKAVAAGLSDPPQDCDWPFCGCDPQAGEVLAAIDESGYTIAPKLVVKAKVQPE